MKSILILCGALLISTQAHAQVSESTADWPAWQKASVGTLAVGSVLATIVTIGLANADSETGESDTQNANVQAWGKERKGQGYVEELKDELLIFVNEASHLINAYETEQEALDALSQDYPVLISYYRELTLDHPEIINEVNQNVEGETLIDRLNTVMMAHLFDVLPN